MQPVVWSSEVRLTYLPLYGMERNELEIRGIQEVKFHLTYREFGQHFCLLAPN